MSSVLVTGCNGTIGRRVVASLLDAEHRILGVSLEPNPSIHDSNFDYVTADLANLQAVSEIVTRNRPEFVVHLAALVHVRKADLGFDDYRRVNYMASKHLFEVAARSGSKRLVFASTVEVYGATPDGATIDENHPCKPESDYARTKLLAESALTEVGAGHDIAWAALRFAPVYAPDFRLNLDKRLYLRPGMSYVLGRGKYELALCSVHNISHFVSRWLTLEQPASGIFNLCDERRYPIEELLRYEKSIGRARVELRLPYWPTVAGVALLQTALNLLGRDSGMYTADNVRKLGRSALWDSSKAASVVGPFPWHFDNTMKQVP